MLKKIFSMFIIITLLVGICGSVNAAELKTTLEVIQQASETKYLENDQGYISKTIVDSNAETGEVTIELKLANTKPEITASNDTEIVFVIDNSGSMDYKTAEGKTRKSILLESTKVLVNNIFNTSSNVKVGVVKFCGETGLFAPLYAAATITKPTDNKEDVLKGIETIEKKSTESGTNIQKGLIKAQEIFSQNAANKVIILLTDGCPNEDAKENNVGNSQMIMENETYQKILDNTKDELVSIKQKGITLISLMTGVNSNDVDSDGNVITSTEDDIQAIERIFGTEENPTAGKFYNANTADVKEIIEEDIKNDVQNIFNEPINTVKIVDYFPEDITENFEFSYVGNPNVGSVSEGIDEETKTISWDIGTLKGNEVATLKYKLKIKDMKNADLLNKTISTNEKVVLTYKDTEQKEYTVELTSSPKIQLSEVKEELIATVTYNPTTNTTGKVTATIKTNKKVNEVDGWTLSEDGMTLTKEYLINTTETVHLVDIDNMTKDVVIKISNIIKEQPKQPEQPQKDDTTATEKLPNAGINAMIIISLIGIIISSMIMYKKYNNYKDIK